MRALASQFAVVFFLGFIGLAVALGYGAMTGSLWTDQPFLSALRYAGLGFMLAGMALWIAARRDEAGKTGLTFLFGVFTVAALALSVIGLLFYESFGSMLILGGLGLAAGALVIGFGAQLIDPAYPRGLTARWPEGGEPEAVHHAEAEHPEHSSADADDQTH